MTKKETTVIEQIIKTQISELKKQIKSIEEKTKPIAPECGLGRLTRMEAMGESHVNHKILDESRLRMTRLKNALTRIDSEEYGLCIECGEDINIDRMKIRPESIRCVACAGKI